MGSLTLGGYDASRFTPSNISIPFAADDSRSLTVGVQSITASNTLRGVTAPLSTGAFFLIDSSVPDLWLPLSSCQLFEEAFGLTYDSRTDLYLVNDTTHASLLQLDPTVAIKLGMSKFDGPFVDINLPYGAFDLQANSPFYSDPTNYFPLRRAANSTQYTLGRTFLQEAYLVVDYEQSNFSVNQAVFLEPNPAHIVTVHSSNYTPTNGSGAAAAPQPHSLDHGAIAGIVVGIVAFVYMFTAIVLFVCHNKGLSLWKTPATPQIGVALPSPGPEATADLSGPIWIPELVDESSMRSPQELSGMSSRIELSESTPPTYEM